MEELGLYPYNWPEMPLGHSRRAGPDPGQQGIMSTVFPYSGNQDEQEPPEPGPLGWGHCRDSQGQTRLWKQGKLGHSYAA